MERELNIRFIWGAKGGYGKANEKWYEICDYVGSFPWRMHQRITSRTLQWPSIGVLGLGLGALTIKPSTALASIA